MAFAVVFSVFVFFYPNVLGHPDNYIPANPMSTPAHIVPEWYFLWVYAILRSIPNKLGGVAAIALVFISLLALPFVNSSQVRSSAFRPLHKKVFWLLVADCMDWTRAGRRPLYYYWATGLGLLLYLLLNFHAFPWEAGILPNSLQGGVNG